MLLLSTLSVSSFDLDSLELKWNFATTAEAISGYWLDIYRSNTPEPVTTESGVFTLLISGANIEADDYYFADTSISGLYHTWRDFYYAFFIHHKTDPTESGWTASEHFHLTSDYQADRIAHLLGAGVELYNTQAYILKRRTTGTQCPDCWDTILGRRTDEHCLTCYDTGFVRGYYPAITKYAVINATPKHKEILPFGEWHPGNNLVTYQGYPRLSPQDIIVDSLNRRWRVVTVIPWEKRLFLISQQAQVEQIDLGDIAYELEIP